jgi:hypothetical protein
MQGLKWPHAKRYGVEDSYRIGMDWLKDCQLVEDWGCGPAYSRKYRKGAYKGIDGTDGFCDLVAELTEYRSSTDGLFMRHVLEHNLEWKKVLENALASFQKRMSLIFFTPWADKTHVVHEWESIPFISFRKQDILDMIGSYVKKEIVVPFPKKGMSDTVFCLEKNNKNDDDRNRDRIVT